MSQMNKADLPASYFLDDAREIRIKDDSGKLTQELLEDAWLNLSMIPSILANQITAKREQGRNAVLLGKLESLFKAQGLPIPTVKEIKSKRASQSLGDWVATSKDVK